MDPTLAQAGPRYGTAQFPVLRGYISKNRYQEVSWTLLTG